MLRPEKMYHFRIIVPSEYESNLVEALVSLGAVHLKPHAFQLKLTLPPLLQATLEGKITVADIDMKDVLRVVRENVGKKDKLYVEMEEIYKKYKRAVLIKEVLNKIKKWGIPPIIFRETSKPLLFRLYLYGPRNVDEALSHFKGRKVIAKVEKLSKGYLVLLIFSRHDVNDIVKIANRVGLKEFFLPNWAYTSIEKALTNAEKKISELKKQAIDVLVEVANLIKSAIEYEYALRLQLLDQITKLCEEAYDRIDDIERILNEVMILKLVERILKVRDVRILRNIGLSERTVKTIDKIVNDEVTADKLISLIDIKEVAEIEDLISKVKELEALLTYSKRLSITEIKKVKEELDLYVEKLKSALLISLIRRYINSAPRVQIAKSLGLTEIYHEIQRIREKRVETKLIPREEKLEVLKRLLDRSESILARIDTTYKRLLSIESDILTEDTGHIDKVVNDSVLLINDFNSLAEELFSIEPFIRALLHAQSRLGELRIFRQRTVCMADGWVPESLMNQFKETVRKKIPKILYFNIRSASPGEEAPVKFRHKGILKYFASLTLARGVPSYWEIDPTIFFTFLFVTMYGLMFGDLGLGLVITLFGVILFKTKKGIFGITKDEAETLGAIAMFCGISSMLFGAFYGTAFLMKVWEPIFISPMHDIVGIIKVTLFFGMAQLVLAMFINIINNFMIKDYIKALLGGTGLIGLIYYIAGAFLAYNVAKSGYNFSIIFEGENIILLFIVVSAMVLVLLTGVIRGLLHRRREELMDSVIELFEMLIAYPANTLSYIRLAAFALAHEVFCTLVEVMGSILGFIPSLILINLIVLLIDGFAAGIQALRLTYYEFSTKFFKGEGVEFKPLLTIR